ncbi:Sm protein (macronuclear) [Tetrahymena thermophila SB210]|uniref:Sm protein n=1 Tax=Tetrahymena thermophila (strain SB210) TaxID=312017 RepID=I7LXX5_TETTS|nr:Sm protein [Tetrahymena thermophila SB210]EAS06720.2 Sm protein [Tetrahymena thermophila SB210]|eukprot:XP_001026962.2 Sm protein [Tetrahymena thermophila SB210]
MITKSELEKKYCQMQPQLQNLIQQNEIKNKLSDRQKAIIITPKSLKQQFDESLLANSNKSQNDSIRSGVYKATELDSKLQSILNSNGKSVEAMIVDRSYNPARLKSQNTSFHVSGNQTPIVEYNQNYERAMKMQKQLEIQALSSAPSNQLNNENIYNHSGATSFYSISSYSSNPQASVRVPSSEYAINEEFSQQKPLFKQPLPITKEENQQKSKQFNLLQSNQKIQTINQLANLKEIVRQKKINEHIRQYQIPLKKIKQEENLINQNNTNLNLQNLDNTSSLTVKNSQGLNTAEKSILYKPEYYQKVGLPMPDSVAKQKKLEREIEYVKENVKPQTNDSKSLWLNQNFRKSDQENRNISQKQINNDQNKQKEQQNNQIEFNNQNKNINLKQGKQILGFRAEDINQKPSFQNCLQKSIQNQSTQQYNSSKDQSNSNFNSQDPRLTLQQKVYPQQNKDDSLFQENQNNNKNSQQFNFNNNHTLSQIQLQSSLISQNSKQENQGEQNAIKQLLSIQQNQNQQLIDQKDQIMNQVKDVILMLIEKEKNKKTEEQLKAKQQNQEQKPEATMNNLNKIKQQHVNDPIQQQRTFQQLQNFNKQSKNDTKFQEKQVYRNDQLQQKIDESQRINLNQSGQSMLNENIKIQQNFQIQHQITSNLQNNNIQISNMPSNNQQTTQNNFVKINQQQPQAYQTQHLIQMNYNNQFNNTSVNNSQLNKEQNIYQQFKKQEDCQKQNNQNFLQNQENILDLLNPKHLLNFNSQIADNQANQQVSQKPEIVIQNKEGIFSQNGQNNIHLTQAQQQKQQLNNIQQLQIPQSTSQASLKIPDQITCSIPQGTLAEIKKAQIEFQQIQTQNLQKRLLSQHEKKVLFIVWMKKNLQDFNYWIQKSKSILDFNFIEEKGQFKCEAKLNIPMDGIKCLCAFGLGSNKKESKKNAMEQLAIYVILNDQIFWVGITGRQYLESVLQEYNSIVNTQEGQTILKQIKQFTNFIDDDEPKTYIDQNMEIEQLNQQNLQSQKNSNLNDTDNLNQNNNINGNNQAKAKNQLKQLKKQKISQNKSPKSDIKEVDKLNDDLSGCKSKLKVQKYLKRIQSCLQEDKIIEALEKLALVGSLKNELKYRDFCYIWNYAIQSRNLTVLKICLDVIHYRKMSSQMTETIQFQSSADTAKQLFNPILQSEQLTQINFTLQKFVSTQRIPVINNQFEQFNTNISYLVDDEWFTMRENPNAHFFSQFNFNKQFQNQSFASQSDTQSIYQAIDFDNFSVENNLETVQHLRFARNRFQKSGNKSQENSSSSNKQKLYISAGKKKTILSGVGGSGQKEDIDLRNASFVRSSALFFKNLINQQRVSNFNIAQQSQIIRKDPYLQYLSWEDLNQMYSSLLYIDDPIFALQACELIYTQTKIDQDLLINGSLNYFVNRKVILYEDFFESLLAKINKSNQLQKNNSQESQNSQQIQQQQQQSNVIRKGEKFVCQGFIQYLGSNYEYDQFSFRVLGENGEILPQGCYQIQEGDLCVLQPKNLPALQSYSTMINQNNRYICLVKELGEENGLQNNINQGQNQTKINNLANTTYQTFKLSIVLTNCKQRSKLIADYSQVYSLYKIASTNSLREKSKSLDNMCTKVSMLHSIFNSIVLCNNFSTNQQQIQVIEQNKTSPQQSQREEQMRQSTIVATEVNLQEIAMENNLNQDQVDALYSGSVNSLTLIQGVKHTGRFRVAISIIQEWLIQSNLKILVKCDTDYKARLFYNSLVSMQQSVSVNSQSNFSSESSSKLLKNSAFQANICFVLEDSSIEFFNSTSRQFMTSKMSAKVKRSIDESKIIILGSSSLHQSNSQCNIVNSVQIANNSNCQLLSAFSALRDCSFNRVIFYNSEQIQESNTWEYLVKNCNQCVMIGDLTAFQREQTRNLFTKSRFGDRSIFENLILSGFKPIVLRKRYLFKQSLVNNQKVVIKSQNIPTNTYNIASLHNNLFFDNQLILFNNDNNSPSQINPEALNDSESSEILIIALKGKEEVSNPTSNRTISDTGSIYNTDEIYMILAIVNNLVNIDRINLSQIRVITPTIAQKTQLQIISSQKLKFVVNAQTIQEPINQTYEYVLFSAVKSNEREDIGVARNPSILSSMLQHTTQKFIFIGDIDLYSIDPTWSDLFQKAFAKKQIKFYHQYQKLSKNLCKIFDSEEKELGEL